MFYVKADKIKKPNQIELKFVMKFYFYEERTRIDKRNIDYLLDAFSLSHDTSANL